MLSLSPALPGPSHLTGHTQQIMALSPDSWPPSSNSDSDARSPAPDPPPIQPRFSPVAAALHPSTCCRSACPAAGLGLTLPPPSSQGVFKGTSGQSSKSSSGSSAHLAQKPRAQHTRPAGPGCLPGPSPRACPSRRDSAGSLLCGPGPASPPASRDCSLPGHRDGSS